MAANFPIALKLNLETCYSHGLGRQVHHFGAHVWKGPQAWVNQHIFRVDFSHNDFDRDFLKLALNYNLTDYIEQAQGGVGLAHITKAKLDQSFLVHPPLPVQRAIADLVARSEMLRDSATSRLRNARRAAESFRRAVLITACSGRLTVDWREIHAPSEDAPALLDRIEASRRAKLGRRWRPITIEAEDSRTIPTGWIWTTPEQLLQSGRSITYGVIKLGPPVSDGVPTLRSSDVRWLRINAGNVKRIGKEIADNYQRTYLQGDEILVTVRGTLGGVALVPSNMAGWNISREVACLPLFRMCLLRTSSSRLPRSLERWLSGVTKGVAYTGVNIEDLKRCHCRYLRSRSNKRSCTEPRAHCQLSMPCWHALTTDQEPSGARRRPFSPRRSAASRLRRKRPLRLTEVLCLLPWPVDRGR